MTFRNRKQSGIYAIRNRINGHIYIGSGIDVPRRWREHRSGLRLRTHRNSKLQNAWDKYGEGAMEFVLIEPVSDVAVLIKREQHWIDFHKAASRENYNINPMAKSRLGYKASAETIEKLRASHVGLPRCPIASAKAAESNRGRKRTPEQCARISASMKGRQFSDEHRAAIGRASTGRHVSAETRAKIGAIHRGRKQPPEQAKRAADAHRRRLITIDGVTKYLRDWINESGVNRSTVMMRIGKYGWDIKRALNMGAAL